MIAVLEPVVRAEPNEIEIVVEVENGGVRQE
jgi:hypothetical protein